MIKAWSNLVSNPAIYLGLSEWQRRRYLRGQVEACLLVDESGLPLLEYSTQALANRRTFIAGFTSALNYFSQDLMFPQEAEQVSEIHLQKALLLFHYLPHHPGWLVLLLKRTNQLPTIDGYQLLRRLGAKFWTYISLTLQEVVTQTDFQTYWNQCLKEATRPLEEHPDDRNR